MQQRCRSCHEMVNKRLKWFGVLNQRYMHNLRIHAEVFRACVILTQLAINDCDKLFSCGYNDHYNHIRGEKRRCLFSGEDSDGKSDDSISLKTSVMSSCAGGSSGSDGSTTMNTAVSLCCGTGLFSLISGSKSFSI